MEGYNFLFLLEIYPEVKGVHQTVKSRSFVLRVDKVASLAERASHLLHEVAALVCFELGLLRDAAFQLLFPVCILAFSTLRALFGVHEFATQVRFVVNRVLFTWGVLWIRLFAWPPLLRTFSWGCVFSGGA